MDEVRRRARPAGTMGAAKKKPARWRRAERGGFKLMAVGRRC